MAHTRQVLSTIMQYLTFDLHAVVEPLIYSIIAEVYNQ